ncbi:DUF1996 domain-containing protein [Streptomyces triticirhizae]|uniref:DUF1996 domain-containing protein n=1 Tax=Streptomyces triticirhizae TaxID=2483353 RepID=A0A3M2LKC9_9ACTN|nr:DUF1996 domain-containing protein [Streptomyces triticirhizae]RMI37260.1 DUF1996 domain-containing protein [Streptomyces triticirhizae]
MVRRTALLSGTLAAAALSLVAAGLGTMGAVAAPSGEQAAVSSTEADHSTHQMLMAPPPGEWIPVDEPVEGIEPNPDAPFAEHREFQANCSVSHTGDDDPIVYPSMPGESHNHTFMGNDTTDAYTDEASLDAGETSCVVPGDRSAYWMPTMYNGDEEVRPIGPQVIYYKSGIRDHESVRPFPTGLRYVVGNPMQTEDEFGSHPGFVKGWECGDDYGNTTFPTDCPAGSQLNVRFQAPSCWDGRHLDSPNHQDHMAYPVVENNQNVCPDSHPVAVPMIEFKMAFPVDGDTSQVRLASGPAYSFHYDFFNSWDEATLAALVEHCINGGLQCDTRGYDQFHPDEGAVLDENHELP